MAENSINSLIERLRRVQQRHDTILVRSSLKTIYDDYLKNTKQFPDVSIDVISNNNRLPDDNNENERSANIENRPGTGPSTNTYNNCGTSSAAKNGGANVYNTGGTRRSGKKHLSELDQNVEIIDLVETASSCAGSCVASENEQESDQNFIDKGWLKNRPLDVLSVPKGNVGILPQDEANLIMAVMEESRPELFAEVLETANFFDKVLPAKNTGQIVKTILCENEVCLSSRNKCSLWLDRILRAKSPFLSENRPYWLDFLRWDVLNDHRSLMLDKIKCLLYKLVMTGYNRNEKCDPKSVFGCRLYFLHVCRIISLDFAGFLTQINDVGRISIDSFGGTFDHTPIVAHLLWPYDQYHTVSQKSMDFLKTLMVLTSDQHWDTKLAATNLLSCCCEIVRLKQPDQRVTCPQLNFTGELESFVKQLKSYNRVNTNLIALPWLKEALENCLM